METLYVYSVLRDGSPFLAGIIDCPCCSSPLADHVHPPSRVTLDVLGSQLVVCSRGCNRMVKADLYIAHIKSQCQGFYQHSVLSPSRITLHDVLEKETESPPTPAEKEVAEKIMRRLMIESGDSQVLHLPTGGQVLQMYTCLTSYS